MSFLHALLMMALNVTLVSSWMSRKCVVLDETFPYRISGYSDCPLSKLSANCKDVSDLMKDLSTVPKNIQILCLWLRKSLVIQLIALEKFNNLKSLYIHGCFSAIIPGEFKGLSHLHTFSMISGTQCNASVPSKVFDNLNRLQELEFDNFVLTEMEPDIFLGLQNLKKFIFSGNANFSELMCNLVHVSASLKYLSVKMEHAHALLSSNCTSGLIRFSLMGANFSFPNIQKVESHAFQYIENISSLSMPMDSTLQFELLSSGIKRIDQLVLNMQEINVTALCEIVCALSVHEITVEFSTLQSYSAPSWEKCQSLEKITLKSQKTIVADLSFVVSLINIRLFSWSRLGRGDGLEEDKILLSLCETNISTATLTHFNYETKLILTLKRNLFACLHNLKFLNIRGNHINLDISALTGIYSLNGLTITAETLSELLAQNTSHELGNLTYLNINIHSNDNASMFVFPKLRQLKSLYLNVHLFIVKPTLFSTTPSLQDLHLQGCYIEIIEDFAFQSLRKLKKLDVNGNQISTITLNTFAGLKNLETLILTNNRLERIEARSFAALSSLRVLHLEDLGFSDRHRSGMQFLNLTVMFDGFPSKLNHLSISSGVRPMILAIDDDSVPDTNLSLYLSGSEITVWGCERRLVKSVTLLDISTDLFSCAPANAVAFSSFTALHDLSYSQWHTSTFQDLSGLNKLVNLRHLDLSNINFIDQPKLSVMFQNLTKLESLSLYKVWIDSLEEQLSSDLVSLKYFYLFTTTEISLSAGFFEQLISLKVVITFDIKLRCTCDNIWFIDWAKRQQKAEVIMLSNKDDPPNCQTADGLQNLDNYGQDHCSLNEGFLLFVTTSCFLLLFMVAVLLHQLARHYLAAVYHITQGWLNEALRGQNNKRHYLYDAFVSYSGRDERWVVEELLPNLEERGPPFLRLCLHSRDFQPGKDIVENITDSLYRSRRTLCLISRHYLRSNWCSLELRLGTYRLQVEHRDVLILVFLDKLPSNMLSAHHRLARLVKTRTYIDWPQDPAQQEAFWDRLWKTLAPEM